MKKYRTPQTLLLIIGLFLLASAVPTLVGCASEEPSLRRVVAVMSGDAYAFDDASPKEMQRLRQAVAARAPGADPSSALAHFGDAFKRVRAGYVREVAETDLIDSAIKGIGEMKLEAGATPDAVVEAGLHSMVASLDPHSAYLNPVEFRESFVSTKGEFGGIGIEVSAEDGVVKVVAPIEDTPAHRVGLRSGDLITHVDGESIKGKGLMHAVNRMRGEPGTRIRLTINRAGNVFDVTLVRAVVHVRAVRWHLEGNVAYIRVVRFTEGVESKVEFAMKELRARLGKSARGVVLDLRNNPGGLLDQSVSVADMFLDRGTIVSVRGRRGPGRAYEAEQGDLARGLPMVVLINGGSASASEIVASALQHNGRATVMGGRSFGKGSVQTITPLPSEGALRLTTALYYGPNGHTLQARGIDPDIVLEPDEKPAAGDVEAELKRRKREADLPGAIAGEKGGIEAVRPKVPEKNCRPVGDKKDLALGCAVQFLAAGSTEKFLAQLTQRPAM